MSEVRDAPRKLAFWWFAEIPLGRVAVLRSLVYAFIFVDVLVTTPWVADHGRAPGEMYQPLFVGRLLNLPTPGTGLVTFVQVSLLLCAGIALSGRLPRLAGAAVFVLYFEWMVVAMSYGKVDHDRFAFLVALAVLPTVGAARWGERSEDERAGWAVRCIQVAVVATYFLAAFAKLRFGGIEWLNGATLTWAVIRRGTVAGDLLLAEPWILRVTQYLVVCFELASPLMLVTGRVGRMFLGVAIVFHLVTYSTLTIIFLPHVICLTAFLPLERIGVPEWLARLQPQTQRPAGG